MRIAFHVEHHDQPRSGAVIPLVTICVIGLMGFVALAIDIGLMAVARTQSQAAADASALAGVRMIDARTSDNNVVNAVAKAKDVAMSNTVLTASITNEQVVAARAGIYRYDRTAQRFQAVFDSSPGENEAYGALQVTISTQQPTYFAKVFGAQSLAISATATAVHRPRDLAIVLDFSGSMGYASQARYPVAGAANGSLNPDSRFPRFGPWSVYGGSGMVLDPDSPGDVPSDLNAYVPPTPLQRVWAWVDPLGESFGPANTTIDTRHGPALSKSFVLSDHTTPAFSRDTSTAFPTVKNINEGTTGYPTGLMVPTPADFANQNATNFVGDKFPLKYGTSVSGTTAPTPDQYAQHVADYLGVARTVVSDATRDVLFETNGYDWDFTTAGLKPIGQRFQGFTMGPGDYGKTFYMWPPDPRTPKSQIGDTDYLAGDWRQRFFLPVEGSTQDMRDNSLFWGLNGRWRPQNLAGTPNYMVNYANILAWLKRGPQTLPASLCSGRVIYYNTIPDTIPVDNKTGLISATATEDERFWKDYIDFVIASGRYVDAEVMAGANTINGNNRNGANLYYNSPTTSHLPPRITSRATLVSAAGSGTAPYLRYDDAPIHPRMQFWFGPITMMGYIQHRMNYLPGTCHEAPCWQLKAGINSAMTDIKINHPNDLASLIYFSSSSGYGTARVDLSRDYTRMQNALFFPYPLLDTLNDDAATIRPFAQTTPVATNPAGMTDNTDTIIPNAGTQTSPHSGFMVAYNQLSSAKGSNVTFKGRRGATKIVIFETDGVPNSVATATLTSGTSGYYYDTPGNISYVGNSTLLSAPPKEKARSVVRQIVALDTANPPGHSTPRMPARVHAIGFGELFEPTTTSSMKAAGLRFLAAVQVDGKTSAAPSGNWDSESLDYNAVYVNPEPYKIITGNYNERIEKLRQALERIMQSGVQVALIQ